MTHVGPQLGACELSVSEKWLKHQRSIGLYEAAHSDRFTTFEQQGWLAMFSLDGSCCRKSLKDFHVERQKD